MKKILLNGVDGNFGSRSARVLLEKYPHEALIFTAPTKNGLEKYQAMGIETRIADFNNAEKLTEAFKEEPSPHRLSSTTYRQETVRRSTTCSRHLTVQSQMVSRIWSYSRPI